MLLGIKADSEAFVVLLDENIPIVLKEWLTSIRPTWKPVHVSEVKLNGCPDSQVLKWAQENKAAIITFDADFVNNPLITNQEHYGIIRLRIHPTTVEETQQALMRLFEEFSDNALSGALVVIGRDKIRFRPGRLED